MSHAEDLPDELTAVAEALKALVPGPAGLDRDRTMFLAGQASLAIRGSRWSAVHHWAWPASTAVMSAAAALLLAAWIRSPQPELVERVVFVPTATRSQQEHAGARPQPAAALPAGPVSSPRGQAPSLLAEAVPRWNPDRPSRLVSRPWPERASYLALRRQVERLQLDDLLYVAPANSRVRSAPPTYWQLLDGSFNRDPRRDRGSPRRHDHIDRLLPGASL